MEHEKCGVASYHQIKNEYGIGYIKRDKFKKEYEEEDSFVGISYRDMHVYFKFFFLNNTVKQKIKIFFNLNYACIK